MAAVHAEHVLEMAAAEDKDPVEALGADRTDPALGARVRFGAWTGVRITVIPSLRKTSSKTWQNFASRSWTTTGATRACSAAIAEGARRFAPRRCAQRRGAERVQRGRPAGRPGGQPAGAAPRGHRLSLGGVDAHTARAAHIVPHVGSRWSLARSAAVVHVPRIFPSGCVSMGLVEPTSPGSNEARCGEASQLFEQLVLEPPVEDGRMRL